MTAAERNTMFVTPDLPSSPESVLLQEAAASAATLLLSFATSESYVSTLNQAFASAGTDPAQWASASQSLQQTLLGEGLDLQVKLLSGVAMNGAIAAYAHQGPDGTQVIYLNSDWLASGVSSDDVVTALLEEAGHAIDHLLNGGRDSAGDEGELFANLLAGVALSDEQIIRILSENDDGSITIGGQLIDVEYKTTYYNPQFNSAAFSADTGSSGSDEVTNTQSQTISGTSTTDSTGKTGGRQVWCSMDGGATWSSTGVQLGSSAWSVTVNLSPGANTVYVILSENAPPANSTAGAAALTYVYDSIAPTKSVSGISLSSDLGSSGADGITSIGAQTILATLSAGLAAASGGASAEELWATKDNGLTWSNISSSVSGTAVSWSTTLAGSDTIRMQVRDAAGNAATSAARTYVVDTDAPTTTVSALALSTDMGVSTADGITNTGTQTVSATLSAGLASAGSSVSAEQLWASKDNGATWTDITGSVDGTTVNWSTTLTGANSIKMEVRDAAGNRGAGATKTYVIDTDAPSLTSSAVGGDDGIASLSGQVGDAIGVSKIEIYEGATLLGEASVLNGNWSFTTGELPNGTHSFTVKATDLAGSITTEVATADTTRPAAVRATTLIVTDNVGNDSEPVPASWFSNDNLLEFSGRVSEPDNGLSLNIWIGIDQDVPTLLANVAVNGTTGDWSFAATSPAADNQYTYYVTDGNVSVWDAGEAVPLNGLTDVSFSLNLDTDAPAKPSAASWDAETLTLSGTVDAGSIVQIYLDGELLATPDGPIFSDGGNGSWTYTFPSPGLPAGEYVFTVTATDDAGNTSIPSNPSVVDIQAIVTATTFTVTDDVGNPAEDVPASWVSNDSLLQFSGKADVSTSGAASLNIWISIDGNAPTLLANVAVNSSTGDWSFDATSPAADNQYVYYVTDGNLGVWDDSKAVPLNSGPNDFWIKLDSHAPDKPAAASWNGSTLTLSGTVEAGSIVQIYKDGLLLATPDGPIFSDGESGAWSYAFPDPGLPPGGYAFTVTATDDAGNISAASNVSTVVIQDNPVCFLAGTRIATPNGEQPIESLANGDMVTLADGGQKPVKWIGRMTVNLNRFNRRSASPILIRAGALGGGLPKRDLYTSYRHGFALDGVLVVAGLLVNGTSIVQCVDWEEPTVVYYHVEVEGHELMFAEGAEAETFAEIAEGREKFDNADQYQALYPDSRAAEPMKLGRVSFARQVPRAVRAFIQTAAVEMGYLAWAAAA
jgi:hypothetical protein